MLKKQWTLLLFVFLVSQSAFPNIKLFPGYYIDLKGDSVRCNVQYKDWNVNPETIHVQVNNVMHEFNSEEIRGFGVSGYADYISAKVSYHSDGTDIGNLTATFSDNTETKYRFLKVVESGVYSLYVLSLNHRICLFMSAPGTPISELVYRAKVENETLKEDPAYKNEIDSLFTREGIADDYFHRIYDAQYTVTDISTLFVILNEKHSGIVKKKKTSGGGISVDIFIGAVRTSFPDAHKSSFEGMNQFPPAYSLGGGLNFLLSVPGKFESFKFGLSFGYTQFSTKVSKSGTVYYYSSYNLNDTTIYQETQSIANSVLAANLYVMYIINPLSPVRVYLKGGANYNISLPNKENKSNPNDLDPDNPGIYTSYSYTKTGLFSGLPSSSSGEVVHGRMVDLKKNYLSPMLAVGVLKGRQKLEFSYSFNTQIANDINTYNSLDFKIGSMALYYYFTLFGQKKSPH